MSDNDSIDTPSADDIPKIKKRRLHGACDTCRKRKVKCDSAATPGNVCTNCQVANNPCTHDIPRQPTKKDAHQAHLQYLEERVRKMERLLRTLFPDKDIETLLGEDDFELSFPSGSPSTSSGLKYAVGVAPQLNDQDPKKYDEILQEESEDLAHTVLSEHLSTLKIDAEETDFFGSSSSFIFVRHALTVKRDATGSTSLDSPLLHGHKFRRPVYWQLRPWELEFVSIPDPPYVYPDDDLLQSLISLYFTKSNILLPVLHQPTFLKCFNSGQHMWDRSFGMTVLLVCAVASRYSIDPRVCMPGDTLGLSSGWKYFCQVPVQRSPQLFRSTIYDVQYYSLAVVYLLGTSIPQSAWTILGLGMRYCLEKGAHRRKPNSSKPTSEDEGLKRAFWCLVAIDRFISSFLGRPCALQDEDFDVDYPVECDDEYWETEDPEEAFKQPPGKPCQLSSFIAFLKLGEILAFALRTLYSTKKSKILTGLFGSEWEQRVVAELDSSLNKWRDSLPYFLRWDPEMKDQVFFHQSMTLYATFYYLRIQVHRPFLTKKSPLAISSHAMCMDASRSCSHVLEAGLSKGLIAFPHVFMAAFVSGIVILLNIFRNNRAGGMTADNSKDLENLQKCLNVLIHGEKRWHIAGRLGDILKEIGSLSEYKPTTEKRRRESFSDETPGQFRFENKPFSTPQTQPSWQPVLTQDPLPGPLPTQAFHAAANMPYNDWDLSNLLMLQMGYTQRQQPNQDLRYNVNLGGQPMLPTTFPFGMGTQVPDIGNNRTSGMGYNQPVFAQGTPPQGANTSMPSISNTALDPASIEGVFSSWNDLPNTFSAEEWAAFLSHGGMAQF